MKLEKIFEAPLPPDWDHEMFSPRASFRKMVQYAKDRAEQVGRGSSRVAFEIPYQGRRTVLKVATNRKGIAQNNAEANLLSDFYLSGIGITIPLIDYDEENGSRVSWVHTEYAEKITKKQLERRFFEGVDLNTIMLNLEYRKGYGRRVEVPESLQYNEYYNMLSDLVLSFDLPAGDFARRANWGLYKGEPVIIDLGLTSETQKLYGF